MKQISAKRKRPGPKCSKKPGPLSSKLGKQKQQKAEIGSFTPSVGEKTKSRLSMFSAPDVSYYLY